ncbi:uncharacterized protein LOC116288946 [Actinia tenebrosa]|uniref:Uncharacterized protein LOC116288946 n=1 Tax=Actinia tenebrosa TaxID=6105 RepID=A0A6P8H8V8_ACTTE|nr:uncharacterized protein LOC116288946 [Actinia tenebrosa]
MMKRQSVDQTGQNCTKPIHFRRIKSIENFERKDDEDTSKTSPASKGCPSSCTDFGKFSMQMDNKAVRLRTAHLHWLIDNKVFTNNNSDDSQYDLRQHRPSNSARYPIRIPRNKKGTDPEWFCSDYRVHIYNSNKDKLWVKQWILGILKAKRFQVTINYQPCWDCDRVIIILSQHFLSSADLVSEVHDGMEGRVSMVIRKEECWEQDDFANKCQVLVDLSNLVMQDYSFQTNLMSWLLKGLSLPESICSA